MSKFRIEVKEEPYIMHGSNGEVFGAVVFEYEDSIKHNGVYVTVIGKVEFSKCPSNKHQAFYEAKFAHEPIEIVKRSTQLLPPGIIPKDKTRIAFLLDVSLNNDEQLYETYHGEHVTITYSVICDIKYNSYFRSDELVKTEVLVQNQHKPLPCIPNLVIKFTLQHKEYGCKPYRKINVVNITTFDLVPKHLLHNENRQLNRTKYMQKDYRFSEGYNENNLPKVRCVGCKIPIEKYQCDVDGVLDSDVFSLDKTLTGEITVVKSALAVKSVEMKLLVTETAIYRKTRTEDEYLYEFEPTVVTAIQIIQGDVVRGTAIPFQMRFPKLLTCPTLDLDDDFKIEYAVEFVIKLENGTIIKTKSHPIRLVRF